MIIYFACYFFDYCSKKYHTNENISKMKLLIVTFGYYSKRDHMN